MEQPDGLAIVTGPCGDTMEISLRIEGNRITESRFQVKGCAVSRACASNAAALAKGKELEEAWDIDERDIAEESAGASGGSPALCCIGQRHLATGY